MQLGGEKKISISFLSSLKQCVSPYFPHFRNEVPSKFLAVSFGFQSLLNVFGPEKKNG